MFQKLILSLFVCSFFFLSNSHAQAIDSLVVCKNVEDLVAIDPGTEFAKGDKVYCWMKVKGATVGQEVSAEWYNEGDLKHSTKLTLNYENMRTYAYKTLHQAGKWKIVIKSADGKELASKEFTASS